MDHYSTPDNTATPAALSAGYSISHTPGSTSRGGGTGLLISLSWKFSVFPTLTPTSFEFHAVAVSHPSKLYITVLYRPPGPLGCFLDELDTLLSSLPEDGTPVILLGDFNLPPESHQSSSVASLLQSFALTLSPSPATHNAGNQLDLVFTRSCSTPQLTVTPLHVSDHYFVCFFLSFALSHSNNSPTVTFRRNLRTLSHSSLISSTLFYTPSIWPPTTNSWLPPWLSWEFFWDCPLLDCILPSRWVLPGCLADISSWMALHHLKLNLDKTELLYIPHRTSHLPELSVTVDGTTVTASRSARNLGVVLDDQLVIQPLQLIQNAAALPSLPSSTFQKPSKNFPRHAPATVTPLATSCC